MSSVISSQTISVNGIELHFLKAGSGPLLLLLHGFPEYSGVWATMLHALSKDYTVVAPDLRGYNLSSQPEATEEYAVPTLVKDVVALIEALSKDGQAYVAGHDWGGLLTWFTADYAPAVCRKVAILNAPHPQLFRALLQSDPEQQKRSAYVARLIAPGSEAQLQANDCQALRAAVFGSSGNPAPEELGHLAAWRHGVHGAVSYYRDYMAHQDTYLAAMRGIKVPTLVLWGEDDHAFAPKILDGLDQHVASLRLVRLPHTGHWLVREQPAVVERELRAFFR